MQTTLERRPSVALEEHADEILALAPRYGVSNIRVFGSTVSGNDTPRSDIDLIAVVAPGRGYEAYAFVGHVETLTGFHVDLVVDDSERPAFIDTTELVPL